MRPPRGAAGMGLMLAALGVMGGPDPFPRPVGPERQEPKPRARAPGPSREQRRRAKQGGRGWTGPREIGPHQHVWTLVRPGGSLVRCWSCGAEWDEGAEIPAACGPVQGCEAPPLPGVGVAAAMNAIAAEVQALAAAAPPPVVPTPQDSPDL